MLLPVYSRFGIYHSLMSSLHSAVHWIFMYSLAGIKLSMIRCLSLFSLVSSLIQSIRFSLSRCISFSTSFFSLKAYQYLFQIFWYSFFFPINSSCWLEYFFCKLSFSSSFWESSCWSLSYSLRLSSIWAFLSWSNVSCFIASFIYSVPNNTFSSIFFNFFKSFYCFLFAFSFSSYWAFKSSSSFCFSSSARFTYS